MHARRPRGAIAWPRLLLDKLLIGLTSPRRRGPTHTATTSEGDTALDWAMLGLVVMVRWLAAFVLTQALECPIYAMALRQKPRSRIRRLAIAFGASTLTHPLVWYAFPILWRQIGRPGGHWGMIGAAEAFALVTEAAYLRWGFGVRKAVLWALAANAASASFGLLWRGIFGWP